MKTIVIWALDGGLATGVAGLADVLAVANAIAARRRHGAAEPLFDWRVQSPAGRAIRTAAGLAIQSHGAIDVDVAADVIYLPGLFIESTGPALWLELKRLQWLLPALRAQHARGASIAANCTATLLLAEAGLLDGRRATTSWWLAQAFQQRYPSVDLRVDEAVTFDGGLYCSGASTAGIQLALRLVERFAGKGVGLSTAKTLLFDGSRGSQAPYRTLAPAGRDHADALVLRGERWIERRLGEPFELGPLAQALAVSERTVIRRFKAALGTTPGHHAQRMKIESAKALLERGTLGWDEVCERVGYADASSFRRLFKREVGVSPGQYQARFAAGSKGA